ncbi:hypothetical protein AeMF1_002977 [Aphanomyces euteiches]|nr:hypothetical protein AeMF1_002977 [Aphanomyces euteiches]KAH9182473.1 hypothetical protein AeNC1_015550 [Aphanomyces euteiches]
MGDDGAVAAKQVLLDDITELEAAAKQVVDEADAIRLKAGLLLSKTSASLKRAVDHMDTVEHPQDILMGFVAWIETVFMVKNIAGLRKLAGAYVTMDTGAVQAFLKADENVTILSYANEASSCNFFPATKSVTKPIETEEKLKVHVPPEEHKKETTATEKVTTAVSKPTKQKTIIFASSKNKGKDANAIAPPGSALNKVSKRPVDTIVVDSPPPVKKTKNKEQPKPVSPDATKAPQPRKQHSKLVAAVEAQEQNEVNSPVEGSRRTSGRSAAMSADFLRRERDSQFREDEQERQDLAAAILNSKKEMDNPANEQTEEAVDCAVRTEYDSIVQAKPWVKWSSHFQSFMLDDSPRRKSFNDDLKTFFKTHAQVVWELFFWLGLGHQKEHKLRLQAAQSAFIRLIFRLHMMEGDNVFKFIMRAPHPAWPTFLSTPIALNQMTTEEAIEYLKTQSTCRWPKTPKPWTYEPLTILSSLTTKNEEFLKKHDIPLGWADKLLSRLEEDKSYDYDACPYIDVTMFGEDPPTHLQGDFAYAASGTFWDWESKTAVVRLENE